MEEETKFEVRDRRAHFTEDTDQSEQKTKESVQKEPQIGEPEASIPVNFFSFVLSLATSALMHLGQGGEDSVHLPRARQVIDLICLLEEKTKGNLTGEEAEMLSETLFALRIKFVEIEKKLRH